MLCKWRAWVTVNRKCCGEDRGRTQPFPKGEPECLGFNPDFMQVSNVALYTTITRAHFERSVQQVLHVHAILAYEA